MAKEMEPQRRAIDIDLDQYAGQGLDQAALIQAILAQQTDQAVPVIGPEWTSQVRPPAIPGTIQETYVRAGLPARFVAFAILWVTWDWKRGAFVLAVVGLIIAIVVSR